MMSKKALFVATVVKAHIMVFHLPYLKMLKDMGYEVHVAAKNDYDDLSECVIPYCDKHFDIPFERSPLKAKNIKAYQELKRIVTEEKYDIIHCHTPVGGAIARLAARKARKNGTKVIYTAHGFHFYKGAPLKNWVLFYPAEKFCAHFTDVLITINQEDFALAKKKMKAKRIEYVPGVGIDLNKFGKVDIDCASKRRVIGIPENAKIILSVGELNENKNHETVIRAISKLNVYYVIAGEGKLKDYLQELAEKLKMSERVKLLGFRTDIPELCKMADVFAFPSFREGLSASVMEAMASGLPVVCSKIRGNTDLIDENGGVLFDPLNIEDCKKAILSICSADLSGYGKHNVKKIEKFSLERVCEEIRRIYISD